MSDENVTDSDQAMEIYSRETQYSPIEKGLKAVENRTNIEDASVFCELCQYEKVSGYGYCKDCEDAEILCLACTRRHTASRKFKHHKISSNLADVLLVRKKEGNLPVQRSNESLLEQLEEACEKQNVKRIETSTFSVIQELEQFENRINIDENKTSSYSKSICDEMGNGEKDTISKRNDSKEEDGQNNQLKVTVFEEMRDTALLPKKDINQETLKVHEVSNIAFFPRVGYPKEEMNIKRPARNSAENFNCGSCEYENINKIATGFCLTCEEPEPMCDECSTQHLKQKLTRNHRICSDLFRYIERHNLKLCEPCFYNKEMVYADAFCLSCPEPEPMCTLCAEQHLKQKISRGHKLCKDINFLSLIKSMKDKTACIPCLYDKIDNVATSFCLSCDEPEPMCTNCGKSHGRQRQTRGHDVCFEIYKDLSDGNTSMTQVKNDLNATPESQNPQDVLPCPSIKLENRLNRASGFCQSCGYTTSSCNTCIKDHLPRNDFEMANFQSNHPKSFQNDNLERPEVHNDIGKIPVKPLVEKITSDSLRFSWDEYGKNVDFYQARYKICASGKREDTYKWNFWGAEIKDTKVTITGLKAKTWYTFQVRGVKDDQELPYSENADPVETLESMAGRLLQNSTQVEDKCPKKYKPPCYEDVKARNAKARTKQIRVGDQKPHITDEKTIMLVGATGSGKSTLVDGIANYAFGVNFQDSFRFTLLQLEEEERKTENQAISQTEWVTVYKIAAQKESRLTYNLNVIDTPGFGDTRGIERDREIVDQIRNLFSDETRQNILYLDCVCFIVKAPDARLTSSQRYVFNAIMSLFGKDLEKNICTLVTFADGAKPPVLASLKESRLPFGSTFQFNNSALFEDNENLHTSSLSPMLWEMGFKSFRKFFKDLKSFKTRSLAQTKIVLKKREQLKTVIGNLEPQINAGLSTLSELKQQLDIFKKHKSDIENNRNFTYEVEETRQIKKDLPVGKHVTNCLQCNVTCHYDCKIADDDMKRKCQAMDPQSGCCNVCTGKCIWSDHKNTPYIFKYVTERVTKTYDQMKEKFERATKEKVTHEVYLQKLNDNIKELSHGIRSQVEDMNKCKNELKKIALCPDPLTSVEHIDVLIEAQQIEKLPGFQERIKMLRNIRQSVLLDSRVTTFETSVNETQTAMEQATGIVFRRKNRNVVARSIQYVKDMF